MDSSSQDRNLPASERKLKKARDDGQVARSTDLSHLAVLGAGALTLLAFAPLMFERLTLALGRQLSFESSSVMQSDDLLNRLQIMALPALGACALLGAIVATASVASSLLAGGWTASLKPLTPDFSRLSPIKGISGLFSKKKLAEIVKMSFITVVLFVLSTWFLSSHLQSFAMLVLQPSSSALRQLMDWIVTGMGLLLLVIFLVAMIDVPLQRFLHRSQLKMSHQEVKDEHKESEGNPQLKGRQRARQRELAQRNSIQAVPRADFVLMNPTHFAVAVQYDEKTMRAPRVISKGADLLAMRIRDVAKDHSVPVLQSPMLARALYAHAELDQDIPTSLYTAVAQVLAYVYRLRAALRGEGPMPGDPPAPAVPPELDPLSRHNRSA
ncbi:MAG: EscU/YscU/HrcU family type III secretion system export apparatus switch protein [Hylemonella sp.]|nr:EscU/YscU/HrcU family type III secretion system export apparatus switch protein [Hylemonella sp.]MDH5707573.1 EscU/YscU/HrcU family type III secretion system export apparatus switch protein [Hylemonella sp.]